jgi:hypothetical protein
VSVPSEGLQILQRVGESSQGRELNAVFSDS